MLYLVIPVFNRKNFTRICLDSLRKQTFKDFKVIVVDDGSTDGTEAMLKHEYPEVEIIKGDGNLFWTAAINLGIEKALKENATYVLTLNNDTIAKEDFLEKMVFWSEKKQNALLGALAIDNTTNELVYGGGRIDWFFAKIRSLLEDSGNKNKTGLLAVDHFPGRGLLIPKEVFDKIGLFNQKIFPHYAADFDFTHQAYKKGFPVYCNYDAKLFTFPEESGDRENRTKKSFKKYYNHLMGIKGGGNLKNFTSFAIRNCPPYYLPFYLTIGYLRRIFGYFFK